MWMLLRRSARQIEKHLNNGHRKSTYASVKSEPSGENFREIGSWAPLLKNVFKKSTVSLYRSDSMQQNLLHGYAFSQDENGVVSQSEVIRAYDTTKQRTNEW
ncbi:probable phospholipid-transporting ATPase IA isoform X1 [Lates japonicus]|uniref:Probable phospholipid-transporting ATPase IA isoform X1 n=1 Tax=Lates japonicus TaxID=270547 RepID=A0AAD3RJN8_LATJO|nr:probable phospholipid-transporting ATPase IA isoform X1 [Lates japonicus]